MSAEEAALAYDEVALKRDKENAVLNFYNADGKSVGQHMKEECYSLM